MSERAEIDVLKDIQEAIHRIQAYIKGILYENFIEDTKTQDAVIRNRKGSISGRQYHLFQLIKPIGTIRYRPTFIVSTRT